MTQRPVLGIIGAGKVGCTFVRLLYRAGYNVPAVYSLAPDDAHQLASQVDAEAVPTPDAVVERADLTLLTVPDDAIEPVASSLKIADLSGKALVHTSGVHDASSLRAAANRGAITGSLHPAFPFADVDAAMVGLPGATFAIEATDERLKGWLYGLVEALSGQVLVIPPGGKATYHLALAIASNYTVTLYAIAEQLLLSLGTERSAADSALNTLVAGTVTNLRTQGIPKAMVGPLVRADAGTIAAHLDVLRRLDQSIAEMYIGLARLSYPMLKARGIPVDLIEAVLTRGNDHEADDS